MTNQEQNEKEILSGFIDKKINRSLISIDGITRLCSKLTQKELPKLQQNNTCWQYL